MYIRKFKIDDKVYTLFGCVTLFPNTDKEVVLDYVAEEKLNKKIEEKIEAGRYLEVEGIDNLYGYYVPQEVADTENEDKIRESIEDVYDN